MPVNWRVFRWFLVIGLIFMIPGLAQAQTLNENRIQSVALYGKVWGFLKYYHPQVAAGKFNWDEVFVHHYQQVKNAQNPKDINRLISQLIDTLSIIPEKPSKALAYPDSLRKNLNIQWVKDTTLLTGENSRRLLFIYQNHQPCKNIYVQRTPGIGNPRFKNENSYSDWILPVEAYRVLGLIRFWNIINYYYPYSYLMDHPWDQVLPKFIPLFINVSNDYEYFRRIQEVGTCLNDGHGMVFSKRFNYFSKLHIIPVKFFYYAGKTYVVDFLDDSLCRQANLLKGDEILKINGFDVGDLRKHQEKFMPASNQTYLNYKIDQWLSLCKTDTVTLEINRMDYKFKTVVHTVSSPKMLKNYPEGNQEKQPSWRLIADSIGYIHMGRITRNEIDFVYRQFRNTRYLILDSRNYPGWILYPLADKILRGRKIFMQVTEPDYDYPGYFRYIAPLKAGSPFNPSWYQGKIIILVNSETMSRAEFTVLAILQAEQVIVIGSQTAGADGDVSSIPFPGGIYCYFSGNGIYHPNGSDTQRIGLVPDILVQPGLEGEIQSKDEYLDRALEYIKNGK